MRNLKRAFSLVLALVMVVSMISIAPVAAADETAPATVTSNFSDAAEIKYTEAVAITGGIGLFAGADGKFMPKGTVTRAQMATIIVKMLYGGDANADGFKGNGKFSDTASFEGGWAEGYINWCSTLGIVAGYGDGTFKPGNQVTTAEAATMILNALKIDAGEGTWPNTVMAKAEEEDLFEDLKPMPGTNTALSREELAVIALNGLNWSESDKTGWYVTGGSSDEKMTFNTYKEAQTYADKVGGEVQPLEGRDTLASTVYDLKKVSGYITDNQSAGEKYTQVTRWDPTVGEVKSKFDVVTDASMIGHKVEVWYEEQWSSEKEPGKTYSVVEAAEYITLTEAAETAKDYKAAFGSKYEYAANSLVVTNGNAYVANNGNIGGYIANSYAPAGTYVIDIETGDLCGYIAPAAYTVAKVSYIDTTEGSERILVGSENLENSADDDEVVEYDGIAKDDYVAYAQVQEMYVLTKLDEVTGKVTKVRTEDGKKVVTLDNGKEYTETSAAGSISNTMTAADLEGFGSYDEVFTFYLDPNGKFVCFEAAEGSGFDMSNTFYVLDIMSRESTDNYGKKSITYFARGVDMTGNEAMIPVGIREVANDPATLVGKMNISDFSADGIVATPNNFYSVEDVTDPDEKELGLKALVSFPTAYNKDKPNDAFVWDYPVAASTSADWAAGGKFEYGVQVGVTPSSLPYGGTRGYSHNNTKFIIVEGTYDQSYALESHVMTGSAGTLYFSKKSDVKVLVTGKDDGTYNFEAFAIPAPIEHTLKATMIYAPKVLKVVNGETVTTDLTPTGRTHLGNEYTVFDANTGEEIEIVLSSSVTSLKPGFHSVSYDPTQELYQIHAGQEKVPATATYVKTNGAEDGRYYENVHYDQTLVALSGTNMWLEFAGTNVLSASGIKVVDVRDDETITKSGVAKVTSLEQVWALTQSMPFVTIELDLCFSTSNTKFLTAFVEVYNYSAYGMNPVVCGTAGANSVTVISSEMHAVGDNIPLPSTVRVPATGLYTLTTGANGDVSLNAYAAGEFMYYIDGIAEDALPTFDKAVDATGNDLTDEAAFAAYTAGGTKAVQYVVCEVAGEQTLVVTDAGELDGSYNTVNDPVSASDFDIFLDVTESAVEEDTIAGWLTTVLGYNMYELGGNDLLVVTSEATGTVIEGTDIAVLDTLQGMTLNNESRQDIDTLDDLKALLDAGYELKGKYYDLGSISLLTVSYCEKKAELAGATLEDADFAATGAVRLEDTTSFTTTITVPAGEEWLLDLNGKTLNREKKVFGFEVSGTLVIIDSVGGGKVDAGGLTYSDGGYNLVVLKAGGEFVLESGELTNCDRASGAGGMLNMDAANTTFIMNGGSITGSSAENHPVVRASGHTNTNRNITINGGTISGNAATGLSSFSVNGGVTLTINGGTITGNTGTNGGAIYVNGGVLDINGGEINGNSATNGGAIYVIDGTVTIDGGEIKNNTATGDGGAIWLQSVTVTMDGGTIANNVAGTAGNGGAVFLNKSTNESKPSKFIMDNGTITGNTAYRGGAIAVRDGDNKYVFVTINGGEILSNIATDRAGTFYAQSTPTFTFTGGTIGLGKNASGVLFNGIGGTEDSWFRNSIINISGDPVIDHLSVQGGNTVNISSLEPGARIETKDFRTTDTKNFDASVKVDGALEQAKSATITRQP